MIAIGFTGLFTLQLLTFALLDYGRPMMSAHSHWGQFMLTILQAVNTRATGFPMFDLTLVHPAMQVLLIVFMVISAYPLLLTRSERQTPTPAGIIQPTEREDDSDRNGSTMASAENDTGASPGTSVEMVPIPSPIKAAPSQELRATPLPSSKSETREDAADGVSMAGKHPRKRSSSSSSSSPRSPVTTTADDSPKDTSSSAGLPHLPRHAVRGVPEFLRATRYQLQVLLLSDAMWLTAAVVFICIFDSNGLEHDSNFSIFKARALNRC